MKTRELKAERVRQGKSVKYMAQVIEKSDDAYAKKERGDVKFSPDEMVAICNDLCLSPERFNAIFFDSELPFSKFPNTTVSEL